MAGNVLLVSSSAGKVYKMSGFSSTVTTSFAYASAYNVAWTGTDVIYANTSNGASIKKGTGFAATVQASFTSPQSGDVSYGISYFSSNVYIVGGSSKVWKMTGFSATVNSSYSTGTDQRGVANDENSNNVTNGDSTKVRLHSGFSSTVSNSFTGPAGANNGIAYDGTSYLKVKDDDVVFKVLKLTGFSSTITTSFTHPAGNAGDGGGIFWDDFIAPPVTSAIKTFDGLAYASTKTVKGLAIASVKTWNGLA